MSIKSLVLLSMFFCCLNVSVQAQESKPQQTETHIEFKSKPRPEYTDAARKKNFKGGTVILRVTLLASGEVGEIVDKTVKDRKKLEKYGLIEKAVAAARQIKFTPAKVNGQPVDKTVTIQYSFIPY